MQSCNHIQGRLRRDRSRYAGVVLVAACDKLSCVGAGGIPRLGMGAMGDGSMCIPRLGTSRGGYCDMLDRSCCSIKGSMCAWR